MSTISPRNHDRALTTNLIISSTLTAIPVGLMILYLAADLDTKHGNLILTLVATGTFVAAIHILHTRRRCEFQQLHTTLRAIRDTQFDQYGADTDGPDNT